VRVGSSDGAGTVNVNNGGTWTASAGVTVGDWGVGGVNVSGGGTWTTPAVTVANKGAGGVNVAEGGVWNSGHTVIGVNAGAVGTINLNGGTWNASSVDVGVSGAGEVNVTNGGEMTVSTGELRVRNSASTLRIDGGSVNALAGFVNQGNLDFVGGTLSVSGTTVGLLDHYNSGCHLEFLGPGTSPIFSDLTVRSGASIRLDGASLNLATGGYAGIFGQLAFGDAGGTVNLTDAQLVHPMQPLMLDGNQIAGSGEIFVGSAGLNLGPAGSPGTLLGTGETERLVIYGDVSGSGSLTHTTVFGNVDVGSSPGLMTLEHVSFGSTLPLLMEIAGAGLDEFDRLILGEGVDFGSSIIDVVFIDGFQPDESDEFQLFSATGGADLFATLDGVAINTPDGWFVNPNTGILAVPEPATVALLCAGAAALRRRRRNR